MKLLIDAGNSRIKWALIDEDKWLRNGVVPVEQADQLPHFFATQHDIQQIWASNVAGEKIAQQIGKIALALRCPLHFVVAQHRQCGVHNRYTQAGQLGCDRWMALLAAWQLVQGACLVVNCGTATTIDTLSAQGEFLGGLILPGVELMQSSLVAATDQLKSARGAYAPYPLNSADALYSGAIQASCGAIERQYLLLDDDKAPVLLSGGAAASLLPHLNQNIFGVPPRGVENLVLHGLSLLTREANA
ncbi:MAG: type III pantothenate kinase [Nitrosomonadales bacterium]|nr:type III pantothenate kinase [Nitrosomonadales bacterium]